MIKILFNLFILLYFYIPLHSQNLQDSAINANIKTYYQLAVQFKDGKKLSINYDSAFYYFKKAAALGDKQSIYAIGYMYFKGLGCKQNYDSAADFFYKGVKIQKDNSLYFYGLCWRNGYGRPKNEDSAKYYLSRSAGLGYRQAMMELESKTA